MRVNGTAHAETLAKIDAELSRSKEETILHFKKIYKLDRPPIWAVCEVMTFGNLSKLYANLGKERLRKNIAKTYDFSPELVESALHHLTYIRNLCAHHSRLWDRTVVLKLEMPKKRPSRVAEAMNRSKPNRIYNTLVMLAYLSEQISGGRDWAKQIRDLLASQPPDILAKMGLPDGWIKFAIWS